MKLHQPNEPRVSRPKAREALGVEEQEELVGFDPHRDMPDRDLYRALLQPRSTEWPLKPGPTKHPAILDQAMYVALFPEDRKAVVFKNRINTESRDSYDNLGLVLLFPDQTQNIKERFKTFEEMRDAFPGASFLERIYRRVLLQLVFPDESAKEQGFSDEIWALVKGAIERDLLDQEWIGAGAKLLAGVRLIAPDRFSELPTLTTNDWKKLRTKLFSCLPDGSESRDLEPALGLAFSMYILAAEEVAVVPGKGIVITPRAPQLGRPAPLPDRPHV